MEKLFYRFVFILLAIQVMEIIHPATGTAQTLDSMMNVYNEKYPQEKVHIHFNKNYYNPGDTIWFKAYIMTGIEPSSVSKNFYAELMDAEGNMLQRKSMPLIGSSAASDFPIPLKYSGQQLHFRAYTTWMLNFDSSFIYHKTFKIITATPGRQSTPAANITTLRFFPEGGDLVTGVESVLAFKANDRFGKPVEIKGHIENAAGKKLMEFASKHYGMGTVNITPQAGESYKAVWKDASGKQETTPLPEAIKNGIVMRLVPNDGNTIFSFHRSPSDTGNIRKLVLIGHMNQQMVYKAKINFSSNSVLIKGSLSTAEFPTGILQMTLFDDQDKPLQERIVFVNNNNYIFDAYLNIASRKLTKRGRNVLELEVPDTLVSNLSIAVTDADIDLTNENAENIYSRLLLTGDLKGYVHNPGYYFSSFADSLRRHLDLVMLTNGWRKFNWEDLAKAKEPFIKYKPEGYLDVRGTVGGIDPARLPAGTSLNVIMEFKDSSRQMIFAPLDKTGRFSLDGVVYYDTAKLYYQFNNDKNLASRVAISMDNGLLKESPPVGPLSKSQPPVLAMEDSAMVRNKRLMALYSSLEAERIKKAKVLEEVVVKARVRTNTEKLDDRYTSGMFRGGDGYSFDVGNDVFAQGAQSVFNYLQGRVAGLQINNSSGTPTLTWRGGAPGVFLDEVASSADVVANMSMNDIAYIKVFRPPFMGGFGGANGAIAIYTKRGGGDETSSTANIKGLNTIRLEGYSPQRVFYSPDYEMYEPAHDLTDIRTTLYWNPYLFFDKDKKKISLSFYNNDITRKLKVIVEGVNAEGKLTRVEEVIE